MTITLELPPDLEARFDAMCTQGTGFPSIDGVLKQMRAHRAALLRVLDQPEFISRPS